MKRKRFTEEHAAGRVAGHERSQDETLCLQDLRTGRMRGPSTAFRSTARFASVDRRRRAAT